MQLAVQFLGETALITLVAVIVAVLVALAVLPFLNQLLETKMSMSWLTNPQLILFCWRFHYSYFSVGPVSSDNSFRLQSNHCN